MVFKKSALIRWLTYLIFLMTLALLVYQQFDDSFEVDERALFVLGIGSALVLLGFLSIVFTFSKVVVTEQGLRFYRWYGAKMIHFTDITEVGHTRFFGGQLLVKGARRSAWVSIDYVGTAELVKLLCEKIGEDRCFKASKALNKRRQELEGLN
ncbi:hypothetical protein CF651_15300 [Paenibacillus rigui]|uniref:DUF304 domain-containing protein n=2 Tax=Paenibacillus rigui TaxID=554312 RepID=A0A229UPU2_9BACL|nr:hypothetical protein CF651_15300 [Paenibacillus rigui]